MNEFGKVDFATSLSPTSAFPLDGRTVFATLAEAQAVAKTAKEIGSTESRYHYGMKLFVEATNSWYKITKTGTLEDELDSTTILDIVTKGLPLWNGGSY